MKKVLLTFLSILMVISVISPSVSAAKIEEAPKELSPELIEGVNEHIELSGKTYKLVNQKELKDKLSKEELVLVKDQLKETNT